MNRAPGKRPNGGGLMADALFTAQGKPGSQMKVIYIGTLAPATSGWWHEAGKRRFPREHLRSSSDGRPVQVGLLARDKEMSTR